MPESNLWTKFQADAFTKENINCLEDPSFHIVWSEKFSPFSIWVITKLELVGSGMIGLKPKNCFMTNNQFGFLVQSCSGSCNGLWGAQVIECPFEWWDVSAGTLHCLLTRALSLCILRKSSRFWVYVYKCITELLIAKRFLEIILSNPSFSDDKTNTQRDEAPCPITG